MSCKLCGNDSAMYRLENIQGHGVDVCDNCYEENHPGDVDGEECIKDCSNKPEYEFTFSAHIAGENNLGQVASGGGTKPFLCEQHFQKLIS